MGTRTSTTLLLSKNNVYKIKVVILWELELPQRYYLVKITSTSFQNATFPFIMTSRQQLRSEQLCRGLSDPKNLTKRFFMKTFYSDKKPKLAKSVISLFLVISAVFAALTFISEISLFFLITKGVYSIRLFFFC